MTTDIDSILADVETLPIASVRTIATVGEPVRRIHYHEITTEQRDAMVAEYRRLRDQFADFVTGMSESDRRRDVVETERHAAGVTPAAAAWVIGKVVEAMDQGPSFRQWIYGMMGFGPESYSTLYCAGGMAITNGIVDGTLDAGKSVRESEAEVRRLRAIAASVTRTDDPWEALAEIAREAE